MFEPIVSRDLRLEVNERTLADGTINIPVDTVIKPLKSARNRLPIFIEAKSAGDFTNTNKRRKEETVKMAQLKSTYGKDVAFNLFCAAISIVAI